MEEDLPPKFGTKKPHFDARREKILVDYQRMTITELERKWHMARGYFYFLRQRWQSDGFTIPTAFADREETKQALAAEGKSEADETSPAVIESKETVDETTESVIEPAPAVDETTFRTEPMNKRTGARAIWKF